jgi:undecaprenyl-diphosphatase
LPLGALAAAVACSRVYNGVHYPTDVAVGAAIGIGVAIGTMKVWPLTDYSAATARPVLTAVDNPSGVADGGTGMAIVVNPAAQSGRGDDLTDTIREALPSARVVVVDDAAALDAALREAASSADALGIVGGDGSINAAVAIAIEHDVALAVFPGGTLNHFARDLGVASIDDTIDAIRAGRLVAVDVGTIDGKPFVNTASFGSYAKLVEAREQLENTIGKWPALIVALVRVLRRYEPLDVTIDGRPHRIWMIFIGNCAYDPPGFVPAARSRLDDGLFDVRIVDGTEPWARTKLMTALLAGTLARSKVYTRQLVTNISFSTPSKAESLAADGEVFEGNGDLVIEKAPKRLRVYAPA